MSQQLKQQALLTMSSQQLWEKIICRFYLKWRA